MILDAFKNKLAKLTLENRLLKFAIIVIALSNVYFGTAAVKALKEKKVFLYPVGYCGKTVVGTREPDNLYVLQMARFIFDSLLTFNPSAVKKQYEAALAVFSPRTYPKYKKTFESYIDDVITSKISSVFLINKIEHSPRKHLVKARGRRIIFFADQPIETKDEIYAFTYSYNYGEFRVLEYGKFSSIMKKILTPEEQKNGGKK